MPSVVIAGTAGVSRAVTGYVDNLAGNATSDFFRKYLPMNVDHLAPYPDFIAFTFVMVLSALLAVGVKESSYLNSILTGLNLITIVTVVIAGSLHVDPSNWSIKREDIPSDISNVGVGGFAPFGFRGIIQGAATSFFGYVGFDIIATTSEEAKNPRRNIPLSIMISLFIVFLTYFSMAAVLTMMVPYYSLVSPMDNYDFKHTPLRVTYSTCFTCRIKKPRILRRLMLLG